MTYSEKISNQLNDLLTKTIDAEKGFSVASEKVDAPEVKAFLRDKVKQRNAFGHELKSEIREFGKLPEKDGSLKGDLHRSWMKLSGALSTNQTERILEEVERGEKASLENYNEILTNTDMTLPPSTKKMLERQRDSIQASLNTARMYETLAS
ncbi:ferritin-like domain-containing protein [Robiginitalea sediminis]|uniref:ferritin-like domain-containing protein n=1 Tax=Robiginitalea sediminis TaxID=1982593 RepID=UPI000B4BD104|nr:PA2169 family four-helix-bundle protein [Robiginitalea sediminis]